MMYEKRKDVVIAHGSKEELDRFKEKHHLTREEGECILAADAPKIADNDIPKDEYYRITIKQLRNEKAEMLKELAELREKNDLTEAALKAAEDKIAKLERALIEVVIK